MNFNIRNIHDFNEFSDEIRLGRPFGNYYLILDGKTLTYFDRLEDKKLREKFVEIMTHCSSAICCRLTPKQKAKITKLLKNKQKRVILSVGDGANDVPMILESSVGVGIAGKEGSQVKQKLTLGRKII